MSEAGWRQFLAAEGVEDWVVLHGGATAFFRCSTLADAAALAARVAEAARGASPQPLLTLTETGVVVRLTRDVWLVDEVHIELARAVSSVARAHGAPADRSRVREVQVAVSARPADVDLAFWRAVLGYAPCADDNAVDPLGIGSTVWMQELDPERELRHAMHIDVSVAKDHIEEVLAAALAAGGRIVEDGDAPEYWILADSAGNKVCVCAWPDGATRMPTPSTDEPAPRLDV